MIQGAFVECAGIMKTVLLREQLDGNITFIESKEGMYVGRECIADSPSRLFRFIQRIPVPNNRWSNT